MNIKIAILGGKSLIDSVFLQALSEKWSTLDISCFGDTGEVYFGSNRLIIQNIKTLDVGEFDLILNLSHDFAFVLNLVNQQNLLEKKVFYFQITSGALAIDKVAQGDEVTCFPAFSVEPIYRALSTLGELNFVHAFLGSPIVELGKEGLNRFHREMKDSNLRVLQYGADETSALAFNVSFQALENGADSYKEALIKSQLVELFGANVLVTEATIPVNKGAFVSLNFELKKKLSLDAVQKKIEEAGLVYSSGGFSTILVENDSQIYFTKLQKIGEFYSLILLFDPLQRRIFNTIQVLQSFFKNYPFQ